MVKGECKTNSRKLHYGLILDRVGLLNDMSFVMKDGSLYPVTTLQLKLAQINGMVKRKILIIDGRLIVKNDLNIDSPIIPEQCLDILPTIYTIYPKYSN